jgi:hypothetical protein
MGAEKTTSHPWSQRCPTEIRECLKWLGKRCALFAEGGRPGSERIAVWVAWIIVPSGKVTDRGFKVCVLLIQGASNARKFPVAPESKMAELHKLFGRVESR